MSQNKKLRVGITHGDFNGISYEVILKTMEDARLLELCTPIVYGSGKIVAFYRKALNLQPIPFQTVNEPSANSEERYQLINVIPEDLKIDPGQSTREAGQAAFIALERATADLVNGNIDVLVTAPINKHNIHSDTFSFPGHTEYLESAIGDGNKALMILCNERMKVALATTHLPVSKISEVLSTELIFEKLETFNASLKRDFRINSPRIAVLALNPHAGDSGLMGSEESEIISPAIEQAREQKILAFGPYSADGFFGSGAWSKFDGILAMYHDQGLAPFKLMAMDSGVNFTAGLPFVRTSPDHGTAYDITGRGDASEASMREAIYMAIDIWRNRQHYDAAYRNPLKKQFVERRKDDVKLDLTKDDEEQ